MRRSDTIIILRGEKAVKERKGAENFWNITCPDNSRYSNSSGDDDDGSDVAVSGDSGSSWYQLLTYKTQRTSATVQEQ